MTFWIFQESLRNSICYSSCSLKENTSQNLPILSSSMLLRRCRLRLEAKAAAMINETWWFRRLPNGIVSPIRFAVTLIIIMEFFSDEADGERQVKRCMSDGLMMTTTAPTKVSSSKTMEQFRFVGRKPLFSLRVLDFCNKWWVVRLVHCPYRNIT